MIIVGTHTLVSERSEISTNKMKFLLVTQFRLRCRLSYLHRRVQDQTYIVFLLFVIRGDIRFHFELDPSCVRFSSRNTYPPVSQLKIHT